MSLSFSFLLRLNCNVAIINIFSLTNNNTVGIIQEVRTEFQMNLFLFRALINAEIFGETRMLISLSEIMTTKDKVAHISAPIELERFEYQGESYEFAHKEPVELTITNLGNRTVMLEGSTNISLTLFCARCLKEITHPMDIQFQREIDFNLSEEERAAGLDETNYIIGYNLDVDTLIYDEILIGFPMRLLCDDNCKGLCKSCGANLNEKTCDCDTTVLDPRMSVIRDIFNNFKEV